MPLFFLNASFLLSLSLSLSLPPVLPQVISQVTSSDTYCRHGSLHAVAEVTYGLAKVAHDKNQ